MLKAVFFKWYGQARNPKCPSVCFFYFIRGYIICRPSIIIYIKNRQHISIFKHVYREITTIELNLYFQTCLQGNYHHQTQFLFSH